MSSSNFGSRSYTEQPCVGRKRNLIMSASTQSMRTAQMRYMARYLRQNISNNPETFTGDFFTATKRISPFYPGYLRLSFFFTQQTHRTESIFEISSILHLIPRTSCIIRLVSWWRRRRKKRSFRETSSLGSTKNRSRFLNPLHIIPRTVSAYWNLST